MTTSTNPPLGTSTTPSTTGGLFGTSFGTSSFGGTTPAVPMNTSSIFGASSNNGPGINTSTTFGTTSGITTGISSNFPINTTLNTAGGVSQAPFQSSVSTSFGTFSQQNTQSMNTSSLSNLPSYTWGGPSQKMVSRYNQLQIQTSTDMLGTDGSKRGMGQSNILGSSSILGLDQFPSIVDQLQRLKNAWDPTHPDCAFQYYFYNRVPLDEVALYVKPLHHNQQKWDEAVANRPENSVVPALAIGFSDIQKRVQLQEQQVMAYRIRMHEIVNKLGELSRKHDLSTTVKISEITLRHLELERRSLALATKVQVLKGRGYALQSEEENLKQRLNELTMKINDPSVFGKMNELWARMTFIREKAKSIEKAREGGIIISINWRKDEEQLEKITKVLGDQHAGISYIIHVLRSDLNEVEKALEMIEERKKIFEQSRSRGSK
ncbi:hypothetical protein PORY_001751 [Pneumocystis oryctolagi]|uniref:Uncharacterized protein n=1 Tax=Pneumocystis oryctolagi TaxID=42067 RepID=A0ACB7CCM4_9ASCO|nr:hypothetical protein PORY_001751 [Pneumocystis oryctolagi]